MSTPVNNYKVFDLFPLLPSPHIPAIGHLKYFTHAWHDLTWDPVLWETTTSYPINLAKDLTSDHKPVHTHYLSKSEPTTAVEHISQLLHKKALWTLQFFLGDFIGSVFLCPKKDGGFCTILNLKEFNKYAEKITFKIETIIHILHLVQPNFFMSAIDITDAFLKVPTKNATRFT